MAEDQITDGRPDGCVYADRGLCQGKVQGNDVTQRWRLLTNYFATLLLTCIESRIISHYSSAFLVLILPPGVALSVRHHIHM